MIKKLKCLDMELAISKWYNPRVNLIIPNVSWGLFTHECDLIVMTQSGYCHEIEIKISKADLKADLKKNHNHEDNKINALYFAIPEYLKDSIEYIPKKAGIMIVRPDRGYTSGIVETIRGAKERQPRYKLTMYERYQLARLGSLRIWGLKKKIKEV